jgi:hypothetical protein
MRLVFGIAALFTSTSTRPQRATISATRSRALVVRGVGEQRHRLDAEGADLGRGALQRVGQHIDRRDGEAVAREGEADRAPDPARPAGDDRGPRGRCGHAGPLGNRRARRRRRAPERA